MSVVRAFIAIDLSPEIHKRLDQVASELKERLEGVPVRWVPVENVHLTLKFLGDVSLTNLEILKKILRSEAGNHLPFEISIGQLGAFPSKRRPRVIWVGVEAPQELMDLQRAIESETTRLGYARDRREFSPHLTLGRISRNANSADLRQIGEVLRNYEVGFLGATRVKEVHLFRSDLQPGGAVYTSLLNVPLSA
ncbi:MAG: RNA 2',3'-cyclic phosphodiesterase [Anaerolineales bacterium]|jgi:2'-5' RNA ligase